MDPNFPNNSNPQNPNFPKFPNSQNSNYPNFQNFPNSQNSQNTNFSNFPNLPNQFDPNFLSAYQQMMQMMGSPINFQPIPNVYSPQIRHPMFPQSQNLSQHEFSNPTYHNPQQFASPSPATPISVGNSETQQAGQAEIEDEDGGGDKSSGEDDLVGRRCTAWENAEDEALIAAFMTVSTDPITNTNQKSPQLWRRVKNGYDEARLENSNIRKRTISMMRNRWNRIGARVMKWIGAVEEADRRKGSGHNNEDVMVEAHKIYRHDNGNNNFTLMHCWIMLRRYPKWREIVSNSIGFPIKHGQSSGTSCDSGKRVRVEDLDDIGDDMGPSSRPEGIKAAKKKKGKKVVGSSARLVENLNERIERYEATRADQLIMQREKLEFHRQKHQTLQRQLDLHEEEMKMKKIQLEWEMLQKLLDKGTLTADEEKLKAKLMQQLSDLDM